MLRVQEGDGCLGYDLPESVRTCFAPGSVVLVAFLRQSLGVWQFSAKSYRSLGSIGEVPLKTWKTDKNAGGVCRRRTAPVSKDENTKQEQCNLGAKRNLPLSLTDTRSYAGLTKRPCWTSCCSLRIATPMTHSSLPSPQDDALGNYESSNQERSVAQCRVK